MNTKAQKIKEFLVMTAGVILLTVGVYFFKIPNGFSTGGVSGIGTVLGKITSITPATWIAVINFGLLILGFIFLGKGTGVKTVYCTVLFSALTWALEEIIPITAPLTGEPFMELIYAMLLSSIGSALLFFVGASSGGTDIVALIMKKFSRLDVGTALLYTDCVVAVSAFFVFGIETGLFSLLGLFAKAFLVDGVIERLNTCKYFVVITTECEKVSEYILESLHHGATMHEAVGEFTGEKRYMLHTVCKNHEAYRLRKQIKAIDPRSFVIITTSSEIVGRGFKAE